MAESRQGRCGRIYPTATTPGPSLQIVLWCVARCGFLRALLRGRVLRFFCRADWAKLRKEKLLHLFVDATSGRRCFGRRRTEGQKEGLWEEVEGGEGVWERLGFVFATTVGRHEWYTWTPCSRLPVLSVQKVVVQKWLWAVTGFATPCSAQTFCLTSTLSRQGLVEHQISIWTRCRDPGGRNVFKKSAKPSSIVSGRNGPSWWEAGLTKPGRACPYGPPRLKRWLESTLQSGLLATIGCRSSSGSERLRRGSAIGSLTWPSGAREGRRLYLEGGGPGC